LPKLKREWSIALMAVTGILLLVFGVNYLKGLDLLQRRNVYHAIYTDITGIAETTPLLLNGFKVGSVVNTQLLPGAGARIMVSYQVNEDGLTLPEDSRVVLTGDLLNKWAELRLGRSAELAQAGDTITGDVKPGIAQTLSDQIDPLKQKAEAILINIDSVLTAFQDVLNPGTRGDINASFRSIRATLEKVDHMALSLDALIAAETRSISGTLHNLESFSANLEANNKQIGRILQNLDTTAATLANGKLEHAIIALDSTVIEARAIMSSLRSGEGTLGALMTNDSLYRNLEKSSHELDLLLEDVRINPNRYVHLSVFGKKDKLPKLSESDVQRIGEAARKEKSP